MKQDGVIRYQEGCAGLQAHHLKGFFVGWPSPPSPDEHLAVLQGSSEVVLAWDDLAGRVVGFANALSDGKLCAFIPLLEVLPEYRKQGIGTELIRRLLVRLDSYYAVDVVCDSDVISFYHRFGFFGGNSMMIRRRNRIGPVCGT